MTAMIREPLTDPARLNRVGDPDRPGMRTKPCSPMNSSAEAFFPKVLPPITTKTASCLYFSSLIT